MRRVIGRLLVALAAVLPLSAALWGQSAQGSVGSSLGTAVMKCFHFKDAMILHPGLTNSAADQVVNAHGRVYGCNKAGGGARFSATLSMTGATCANRRMIGTATFSWANGTSSTAAIMFVPAPVEPKKVEVIGTITSGFFDGLLLHSFVRTSDTFKGSGAGCGPSNPLTRIEFTNSQSLQLFTPVVPSTTVPQKPPPPTTNTIGPKGSTATTARVQRVTIPNGGGSGGRGGGGGGRGTGNLALTGANSSRGALLGLESLIVGAAVWAIGGSRRRHDVRPTRRRRGLLRRGARPWLYVIMPGDRP